MKYRITILIIIVIGLGQILLSYIANTILTHAHTHTHTHARTHAHTHTHAPTSTFKLPLFDGSVAPNRDGVNAHFRRFRWRSMAGRRFIQINTRAGDPVSPSFEVFSRIKKLRRRTETRTKYRMYCKSIRTV